MKIIKLFLILYGGICLMGCQNTPTIQWYRGNTHTHSTLSDGDVPFAQTVRWYKDAGYDFMLATDHNINYTFNPADTVSDFLIIGSNEVCDGYVHLTAMGLKEPVDHGGMWAPYHAGEPCDGVVDSMSKEALFTTIYSNGITKAGGIAFINHPNFITGVQASDLYSAPNLTHIEVFNGHPLCFNWGDKMHDPVEQKWDDVLSHGKLLYAVASDDTHMLLRFGADCANPGRGWIMVRAAALTQEDIMSAVSSGDFYASSGVFFSNYQSADGLLSLLIDEKQTIEEYKKGFLYPNITVDGSEGFSIRVIGEHGKELARVNGTELDYKLPSSELYARAVASYTVKSGDEYHTFYAWSQPIFN